MSNVIAKMLCTEQGRYELAAALADVRVTIDVNHKDAQTGAVSTLAILNLGSDIVAFGNVSPSRNGNGNYVMSFGSLKEKAAPATTAGAAGGLMTGLANMVTPQQPAPAAAPPAPNVVQMPNVQAAVTAALSNLPPQ